MAPLKIQALDKDLEVIVLRPLPERESTSQKVHENDENPDSEGTHDVSLTAEEIESSFTQKQPTREEIVAGIEEHRPTETVISKEAHSKIVKSLSRSYLSRQLRSYLRKRLPERAESKQTHKASSSTDQTQSRPITKLAVSSFKSLSNRADSQTGAKTVSKLSQRQVSTASKSILIDAILRQVWGVRTEDEHERLGVIEIHLSRLQWGLLNTREDRVLFATLRNSKFFQRTRFDRDPRRGCLIVRGPRMEAEQVAKLFDTAFAGACSFTIDLARFKAALFGAKTHDFDRRFSQSTLQEIMYMTKTFITYSQADMVLNIAAFYPDRADEARRLVVMMLDRPRNQYNSVIHSPMNSLLAQEPINLDKVLPSWARVGQYVRNSLRNFRSQTKSLHALDTWAKLRPTAVVVQSAKEELRLAQRRLVADESAVQRETSPHWRTKVHKTPWTARFGALLHQQELKESSNKLAKGSHSTGQCSSSSPIFADRIPALLSIASHMVDFQAKGESHRNLVNSRLLAKLIPSPLIDPDVHNTFQLPTIEFEFALCKGNDVYADAGLETHESHFRHLHSFDIGNDSTMVLRTIRATLKETTIDVPMPHSAVDIRFSSQSVIEGNINKLLSLPEVDRFVDSIASSMRAGADLRAAPVLQIPLSRAMIPDGQVSPQHVGAGKTQSLDAGEVAIPYLFAGFEHREAKHLQVGSDHFFRRLSEWTGGWTVEDVEGGVSGGRSTRLATQLNQDPNDAQIETFVDTVLLMSEMINRADTGRLRPLKVMDARAQESTNVLREGPQGRHERGVARPDFTIRKHEVSSEWTPELD